MALDTVEQSSASDAMGLDSGSRLPVMPQSYVFGTNPRTVAPPVKDYGDRPPGNTSVIPPGYKPPPPVLPTQVASTGDPAMQIPPEAQQVVRVIRTAEGTSRGDGNVLYGGQPFTPGHDHPGSFGAVGPDGRPTSAAGPGQWEKDTWKEEKARAAAQGIDLDFANPQHQNWAMWDLASRTYQARTGRALQADVQSGQADYTALGSVWQGLQSGVGPHLVSGSFTGQAKTMIDDILRRSQEKSPGYDEAIREAKDLHSMARSMSEKWMAESDKPPQNMRESWSQWGNVAGALALFGGLFGRRNMTAAIGAAGEMMQAANSADQHRYDDAYRKWKDHLDMGLKAIELLNKDASTIIEDANKAYDQKQSELKTLISAAGVAQGFDENQIRMQDQNLNRIKLLNDITQAQNTQTQIRLAAEEKDKAELEQHPEWNGQVPPDVKNRHLGEAQREHQYGTVAKPGKASEIEIVGADNKVVRSGQAYQDGAGQLRWLGTNEPVDVPDGATLHGKSVAQPRSASAMAVQKFKEENPDATADDIVRFQAKQARAVAVERAFGAGVEARNVTSLNTVADHLETFEEAANALQNGDIPRLNALRNRVRIETGDERPLDFAVVQEIASREISKAVVGGPGAAEDRQAMAKLINDARSPEQLAGAFKISKQLIAGRLENLGRQYSGNDPERRRVFEEEMLSPIARKELLSVSREHQQQGGAGLPEGVPIGSRQIGTYQGKPVYETPDGRRLQVH